MRNKTVVLDRRAVIKEMKDEKLKKKKNKHPIMKLNPTWNLEIFFNVCFTRLTTVMKT